MIVHINKQAWLERLTDLCSAMPDNFNNDFERIQFTNLVEQTKSLWKNYGKKAKSEEEVWKEIEEIRKVVRT